MTTLEAKADLKAQVLKMQEAFRAKSNAVGSAIVSAVVNMGGAVEGTAKRLMRDATTDNTITYGKHGHNPSVPGSAPAVDIGTLRNSITHVVEVDEHSAKCTVGSTLNDPPYGAFLEWGTSKMQPRPWLRPSLDENKEYFADQAKKALNA